MHGNFKLILNNPIKNRYVIDFKTEEDITNIITLLGPDMAHIDEDFEEYNDQDQKKETVTGTKNIYFRTLFYDSDFRS